MEFNKENAKHFMFMIFGCILFYLGVKNIAVIAAVVGKILGILFPFILGAAIAFIINVPMTRIEYWLFHRSSKLQKARRPLSLSLHWDW